MTQRKTPEIKFSRPPKVQAFEADPAMVERWNASIRAADAGQANVISVLDEIGSDMFGEGGVTAKRVAAALRTIKADEVVVDINSPGGDFFEGVAIYNQLRADPRPITVRILGIAASAASVVAMAGDRVEIGRAGFLMVHNAWVMAIGNRNDLRKAADMVEPFDDAMASVYAAKAGVDLAQAAEWMDAETYFSGEQAVDIGLADDFLDADLVQTGARASADKPALRKVDAALAKAGIPRSERRTLLAEVKGGTHDAALTVTHDADEIRALIEGVFKL